MIDENKKVEVSLREFEEMALDRARLDFIESRIIEGLNKEFYNTDFSNQISFIIHEKINAFIEKRIILNRKTIDKLIKEKTNETFKNRCKK
ncbi:hypothetical protein FP3_000007 [Pasteurella phage vB_PmuM_CFP3]|uniref:Uncharacterized protein n=1 Tax=Pasteurella phage vB_PmuM_CFP3 TaxID=3017169 RepID=A0AAE9WWK7_9CAUD|nr:hypothetical protein FP3_000007 [Pasteurella phage vB_PmuM_CFP3]HDR1140405.1 hypothetical protein [Pasteurella multocida]HEP0887287.1 hypothetical protein [Pasteurella multocida]